MIVESLRHLIEKRYGSRFRAMVDEPKPTRSRDVKPSSKTSTRVTEHRLSYISKHD